MEYVTPSEMRKEEERALSLGISTERLMENAGRGVAEEIVRRFGPIKGKQIVTLCGLGNNGGDGFVAGRYLSRYGAKVSVILLAAPDMIRTQEAMTNWKRLEHESVERIIAPTVDKLYSYEDSIISSDIVIDAIFGTGVKGRIGEPFKSAIEMINRSSAIKVALDIPSGLDPLTGEVREIAVRADITFTLHKAKIGLKDRKEYTGEVVVIPIGISNEG